MGVLLWGNCLHFISPQKAVRYNYTQAERSAMVELLAMIIDIRGKMARMSSKFIVALKYVPTN